MAGAVIAWLAAHNAVTPAACTATLHSIAVRRELLLIDSEVELNIDPSPHRRKSFPAYRPESLSC
jgi:hypothetical protein